jgi:hypothetical protein
MEFNFKNLRTKYPILKIIKKPKKNINSQEIYNNFTHMYNQVNKEVKEDI